MSEPKPKPPKEWTLTLLGPDGSRLTITGKTRKAVCEEFWHHAKAKNAPELIYG